MTAWQQQPFGITAVVDAQRPYIPLWWFGGFPVTARLPEGTSPCGGPVSGENHSGSGRLLHGQTAVPVITHNVGTAEVIARTGCAAYSCRPLEIYGGEPVLVPLACGACCCPRRMRNQTAPGTSHPLGTT